MAHCPKCKHKLKFEETISLSRLSNRVLCSNCNTVLEVDKSILSYFGAGITGAFLLFTRLIEKWFGDYSFVSIIIFIIITITVCWIYYVNIKLKISENQDTTNLNDDYVPKERPPLKKNASRIEYLKNKFLFKSDDELEYIVDDINRTKEAKLAARELLNNRRNK